MSVMRALLSMKWSFLITIVSIIAVLLGMGPAAALTTMILIAIEIAFSFDNAILNAKILEKLSGLWQKLFLTVGVVLAIFGMRILFPIALVALAAHIPWHQVVNLALNQPAEYARHLQEAHVPLSAFGGGFLLSLALFFFFDHKREVLWLWRIERPLQKIGGSWWVPTLIALLIVGITAIIPANHHLSETLRIGAFGVVSYTAIHLFIQGLNNLVGNPKSGLYSGWAAFVVFMYLQVLDASFSFDGVLGAFAITKDVVLIAVGLGVGAIWVRSLTVYMVKHKVLEAMIYLEHGAHYAILALALALLASIVIDIPDAVTGIIGMGVIVSAIMASKKVAVVKH